MSKEIRPLYRSVKQFAKKNEVFTEGSLRWLIHNSANNGLDKIGAIKRLGRKVLIDEIRFYLWIEKKNES